MNTPINQEPGSVQLENLRNRMDRALAESGRGEGIDGEQFMQKMLADLDAWADTATRQTSV